MIDETSTATVIEPLGSFAAFATAAATREAKVEVQTAAETLEVSSAMAAGSSEPPLLCAL
jgi:hypothetical protein